MKNKELSRKIKELRNRKGYSQEQLSEKAGLSLRTIQRIENGETEPRGDSLKRLADVFDVLPDEITDWTIQENKGFLITLNLSALSFIILPPLGILIPLAIWISKKDRIKGINDIAKSLLNFQITWTIFFFLGYIGIIVFALLRITPHLLSPETGNLLLTSAVIFCAAMHLYNLIFVIVNSIRLNNEKTVRYYPAIRFLKE